MMMKCVLLNVYVFLAFLAIARGSFFTCDNGAPGKSPICIRLDFEATINVTSGLKVGSLMNMQDATENSSLCDCSENNRRIVIRNQLTHEMLEFLFKKDELHNTIQYVFHLIPTKHGLPSSDHYETVLTSKPYQVGKPTQAYRCRNAQSIYLHSHNYTYEMVLTTNDLEVQAFGLAGGQYSRDVFECEADARNNSGVRAICYNDWIITLGVVLGLINIAL